jgi:hypothetical protein
VDRYASRVIVVVGNPRHRANGDGPGAGGLAVGVATAAASVGADVQIVGKTGEDPAGEAVLLALAKRNVGHVALLRDPTRATAEAHDGADTDADASDTGSPSVEAFHEPADQPPAHDASMDSDPRLSLEPADLALALRYLPDYRVVVVVDPLVEAALAVVVGAAAWNGAAMVLLVPPGSIPPAGASDATIIEAPETDPDDAFAGVVGRYAAALDRGESAGEAFASASAEGGWSAVAD